MVFVDESGFRPLPAVLRTYAPLGQTLVMQEWLTWDHLSVISAITLAGGVFTAAGATAKTNLLFFTRGGPTEKVWYYDLSAVKVGQKTPLTTAHFDGFFRCLPGREDSERRWTVARAEIEARNFDLKAVNPHARNDEDTRAPEGLLDLIEDKGREVAEALAVLRGLMASKR